MGVRVEFTRDAYPSPGPDADWAHFATAQGGLEPQPRPKNLANCHLKLQQWLEGVNQDNVTLSQITEDMNRLVESMNVLQLSGALIDKTKRACAQSKGEVSVEMQEVSEPLVGDKMMVTGCIAVEKLEGLRHKLHTVLRGNFIMTSTQIAEPLFDAATGAPILKAVFLVYCPGKDLSGRVERMAKAFGASLHSLCSPADRAATVASLGDEIYTRNVTFHQTMSDKYTKLQCFYQHAKELREFVSTEQLIYFTLNKCSDKPEDGVELKFKAVPRLRANVWVPTVAMPQIRAAVDRANKLCSVEKLVLLNTVPSLGPKKDPTPPTFTPTNGFTAGFQAIVGGYGIPDYKELNPTVFATAMFPFLFGVMFGDIVHGALMTLFGLVMILKEDKINAIPERNEIFEYMFSGRYTLFMMGLCATYMGFIYNEALSLSMDLWGSAYAYSYTCSSSVGNQSPMQFPDFAGNRVAATAEATAVQYDANGCTAAALKSSDTCWRFLGEEKYFNQLPCGLNPKFPCSQEIVDQVNLCYSDPADQVDSVAIKMEPMVVPAGGEPAAFLPSSVGQPVENSHGNGTVADGAYPSYTPYKFGVDPVWRYSGSAIQFTNSLKMKISVILGVSQMTFGILLKWLNTIHFGKFGEFCAVCIPELLFMCATFGYMNYLIFLKWSTDYTNGAAGTGVPCFDTCPTFEADSYEGGCFREPPMIITTLIGMFMAGGTVGQDVNSLPDRCKQFLFESQESVQFVLLLVAVVCVPWLFCVEPILVYRAHKAKLAEKTAAGFHAVAVDSDDSDAEVEEQEEDDEDGFSMGDVIVGQSIHAIEFILGCVSNTASYLRLWALSLAHSQLSEVFMEYIFKGYEIELLGGQYPGIASQSVSMIVICFAVFFACNIAVLMVMESLSAFLHALRLQWVEFQNKFYHATGHKFTPLDFEDREQLVASGP